jgi:serine protease Do
MNTRTRTIASFFSVAMATMLLGALVTTQIQRPERARAASDPVASTAPQAPRASITLDTFRDIAREHTAGVVNINTRKVIKRQAQPEGDWMERFFFGPHSGPESQSQTQTSLGSGFVIDQEGHVLTNRHVVEGADEIRITLSDGKEYEAKLVGRDSRTDVALLKFEPEHELTVLEMGDSDQTEVGEWVMAIGNPFGLGGNSVTVGVVSFKGRPLTLGTVGTSVEMIQTDASINPGNSGGPLLNTRGEVIGINTMIITRGVPQSAGVGFAVPINVAKAILPQLRERGKVIRGWLGVQIQTVTDDLAKTLKMGEAKGAIVSDVTPDSPAADAGIEPGDVIVRADQKTIEDNGDLSGYISSLAPGTRVELDVVRDGAHKTVHATLGTFKEDDETEEETPQVRAQLGMTLHDLNPEIATRLQLPRSTRGVVVMEVEAGEAAEDAGLARFDVIVSVNGQEVSSMDDFEKEIAKAEPEGLARLRVRRGSGHLITVLKLK